MSCNKKERILRLGTKLILGIICLFVLMAGKAIAARDTYTDEQGFVYDASGYFDRYGKTIVGYEGNAKTVTIPADVGGVFFMPTYNYSSIETISLHQIQRNTQISLYGSFPSLKQFIPPDDTDAIYHVEDGVLLRRGYTDTVYGYFEPAVVRCPAKYSKGSYTVPSNAYDILQGCFRDCTELTSVTIHDNVMYIGDDAFNNCISLKKITLPEGLDSLQENLFNNCVSLEYLRIPSSVNKIYDGALNGVKCVIDVARGSYAHKYFLFKTNGEYTYTVDGQAPSESDGGIEDGLTYFVKENGKASIVGCNRSGDIVIPETIAGITVDNLEERLFYNRSGITSVSIPATVTYFGTSTTDNDWDYVFSYCQQLKAINVDPNNPVFCSKDGVLYSKDMKTLINYPVSHEGTVFQVPEETKTLCCTSFASCKNLKKLYLNHRDAWWYTYTFYNTGSLTVFYIPGGDAERCMNEAVQRGLDHEHDSSRNTFSPFDPADMAKLVLPSGLKTIDSETFMGVNAMKIIVPSSVSLIRNKAFSGCPRLKYLVLPDGPISIADDAVQGCPEVVIVCSSGSAAEAWAQRNNLTVKHP